VDYLRPTPIDTVLELRGKAKEIKERKIVVSVELLAKGKLCVRGEVVAVKATETTFSK
jgi:acyl-CoA thioesterase FadM